MYFESQPHLVWGFGFSSPQFLRASRNNDERIYKINIISINCGSPRNRAAT